MEIKKLLPNGYSRCCFTHNELKGPKSDKNKYYQHDNSNQCLNFGKYSYEDDYYCPLHSPEHKSNFFGSEKAKLLKDAIKECNKTGANKSIRFVGACFGEIDLQNQTINSEMTFIDCEFLNILDLTKSRLKAKVYFKDCHFDLPINFNGCNFKEIIFKKCTFNGCITFDEATGESLAIIRESSLLGGLTAISSQLKQIIVRNSKIDGVDINSMKSNPHIRFESVNIEGDFNCAGGQFKLVEFLNLEVMKKTNFKNSSCGALGLLIKDCAFKGESVFTHTSINYGRIEESTFYGKFSMIKSNLNNFTFENCNFESRNFFNNIVNTNLFGFKECNFKDKFFMKKNEFKEKAYFIKCIFKSSAEYYKSCFQDHITFEECQFRDRVTFNKTDFHSGPKMNNVEFEYCPEFHDATLSQGADFRGATFKNFDDIEAPPSYRTLKHAMNKNSNKLEEAKFHAFEHRAIRMQKETKLTNWIFSYFYDITSQYGQNYKRVFWSLLGINSLFLIAYMAMVPRKIFTNVDRFFIELLLASKIVFINIIAPFKLWFGRENEILHNVFGINHPWYYNFGLAALTSFQTIISLTLITLFVLALRRSFKLN